MTPFDHLQAFVMIFNRALAELPASQRQILSDLATPHGEALAKAVAPGSAPVPGASNDDDERRGASRSQDHA
jgi:hypothetical protein